MNDMSVTVNWDFYPKKCADKEVIPYLSDDIDRWFNENHMIGTFLKNGRK